MNRTPLPQLLVPATAVALAVLLLFHPQFEGGVYEGLRGHATRWIVVHVGLAVGAGLMTAAAYRLIEDLSGRAATVSRCALAVFPILFIAWEATLGIGTGLMVDQANSLPVGDRAPVADAIQGYFDSPVLLGLSAIGNTAWIVAMVAAAVAFRGAGARRAVVLLVGLSSVFVMHDAGPVGAIGLVCFAAAAVLVGRGGFQGEGSGWSPDEPAPALQQAG